MNRLQQCYEKYKKLKSAWQAYPSLHYNFIETNISKHPVYLKIKTCIEQKGDNNTYRLRVNNNLWTAQYASSEQTITKTNVPKTGLKHIENTICTQHSATFDVKHFGQNWYKINTIEPPLFVEKTGVTNQKRVRVLVEDEKNIYVIRRKKGLLKIGEKARPKESLPGHVHGTIAAEKI